MACGRPNITPSFRDLKFVLLALSRLVRKIVLVPTSFPGPNLMLAPSSVSSGVIVFLQLPLPPMPPLFVCVVVPPVFVCVVVPLVFVWVVVPPLFVCLVVPLGFVWVVVGRRLRLLAEALEAEGVVVLGRLVLMAAANVVPRKTEGATPRSRRATMRSLCCGYWSLHPTNAGVL